MHETFGRKLGLYACAPLQRFHIRGVIDEPRHIGLVGGYIEGCRRTQLAQTTGEREHALATAVDGARTGPQAGIVASKDLREPAHHTLSNALMLSGSQRSEQSAVAACVLPYLLHSPTYTLA